MRLFALLAVLAAALLVVIKADAASPVTQKIQITDARGLPISDAVVEVHPAAGASGPIRFPWRMGMAQRDLQFTPGTLIVAKGSTVAFPNLDKVRHSIYSFSKAARFEIDLYGRDQTRTHRFPIAGSVALGCNIHDTMRGYIRVTDTPHAAKTDRNGYVTLNGLPRGAAKVTVWHPQVRGPGNEHREQMTLGTAGVSKIKVNLR